MQNAHFSAQLKTVFVHLMQVEAKTLSAQRHNTEGAQTNTI